MFNSCNEFLRFHCQKILPLVYDDSLSYYETVCKVVNKINTMIAVDNDFASALNDLINKTNKIDKDINLVVGDILTGWLNDGTLDKIVRDYVGYNGWIPTGDDISDFRTDVMRSAVSHMVHAVGTDSVIPGSGGLINIDTPFAAVYSNTLTHEAAFNFDSNNFDTSRTEVIQGVSLPLGYFDCSSFLTLLDSCRIYGSGTVGYYNESPYHYAFKNALPGTDAGVVGRCTEAGTNANMPYTFDYLNNIGTARMAYMMDMSGNKIRLVASRNNLNEIPVFFDNIVATMETGDQVFFGKEDRPDIYKRIGHCGLYVKTLDELNEFGAFYNARFRAIGTGAHPEYGYVVHVTGGTSDGASTSKYKNVMRVDTLFDTVYEMANITIFYAKPYSNALISNKARRVLSGVYRGNDANYPSERDLSGNSISMNWGIKDNGTVRARNVGIFTTELTSGDANNIENGFYFIGATNTGNIANLPTDYSPSNYGIQLFQMGQRMKPKARGLQFCLINTTQEAHANLYWRCGSISEGLWSPWKKVASE